MATQVQEYTLSVDNATGVAKSYFPGITYDDYDRGGGVSPWKICRMFEAGRMIPFYQGNFLNFNDLVSKDNKFYVLGGDYYFDSCLWEVTRKYHYFPYRIEMDLVSIGQSSLTLKQVLINSLDHKEVATNYLKIVYVNTVTKQSHELPYWFRKQYRGKDIIERVRVDFSDYSVPSTACKLKTVVTASDTDVNGHTNQASYVRFCMDAAAMVTKGKDSSFTRLTHDICLYPILKMTTAYRNETVMGDELVTSVWEDDLSPQILYFAIHSNGKLTFTSTIRFKSTACSKL